MNNYTTYPTCGTTESNYSIEIKNKSLLKDKTNTILKVTTYFVGIIVAFMIASALTNLIWPENSKQIYKEEYEKGYKKGYNKAKFEALKQYNTIDISKAYQYEYKK